MISQNDLQGRLIVTERERKFKKVDLHKQNRIGSEEALQERLSQLIAAGV